MSVRIELKLDAFEGPLDLLLHLVEQAEIDIYDIPIAEITRQYMEVLSEMQQRRLEIASEFIVMASTLLAMKSHMLLPKPDPDVFQPAFDMEMEAIDPRQELIMRLIEYKRFKRLAEELKEREKERAKVFSRVPSDLQAFLPEEKPNPVKDVSIYDLVEAFQRVMQQAMAVEPISRVSRDEISVGEQIDWLREKLAQESEVMLSRLFTEMPSREAIIVTFLAVLELMKKHEIVCEQHRLFSEIVIRRQETNEVYGANGLQ